MPSPTSGLDSCTGILRKTRRTTTAMGAQNTCSSTNTTEDPVEKASNGHSNRRFYLRSCSAGSSKSYNSSASSTSDNVSNIKTGKVYCYCTDATITTPPLPTTPTATATATAPAPGCCCGCYCYCPRTVVVLPVDLPALYSRQ